MKLSFAITAVLLAFTLTSCLVEGYSSGSHHHTVRGSTTASTHTEEAAKEFERSNPTKSEGQQRRLGLIVVAPPKKESWEIEGKGTASTNEKKAKGLVSYVYEKQGKPYYYYGYYGSKVGTKGRKGDAYSSSYVYEKQGQPYYYDGYYGSKVGTKGMKVEATTYYRINKYYGIRLGTSGGKGEAHGYSYVGAGGKGESFDYSYVYEKESKPYY
uniref:Uncharacterized protein n=1 Tax=Pseudo-nitzschia australis TaxID=44445 RepID=A0A7S4AAG5_9STRA